MGKIVAIVNRKGGVGKTTLSLALADVLAGHTLPPDRRSGAVLVVDLDPQGSLTAALMNVPNPAERRASLERLSRAGRTIHQAIETKANGEAPDYASIVQNGVGLTHGTYAMVGNDAGAWATERKLAATLGEKKVLKAVAAVLAQLAAKYQYVIIDCPPGQTLFAEGVLGKADLIICPVATDALSLWGMEEFRDYLQDIIRGRGTSVAAYWLATKFRKGAGQNSPEQAVLDELTKLSIDAPITLLREAGNAAGGVPRPFVLERDDRLVRRLSGPTRSNHSWSLREAYRERTLSGLRDFAGRVKEILQDG